MRNLILNWICYIRQISSLSDETMLTGIFLFEIKKSSFRNAYICWKNLKFVLVKMIEDWFVMNHLDDCSKKLKFKKKCAREKYLQMKINSTNKTIASIISPFYCSLGSSNVSYQKVVNWLKVNQLNRWLLIVCNSCLSYCCSQNIWPSMEFQFDYDFKLLFIIRW